MTDHGHAPSHESPDSHAASSHGTHDAHSTAHASEAHSAHPTAQQPEAPKPVIPLTLSPLTEALLTGLERKHHEDAENKISVNPLIAKLAGWYEKFRNVMEYRQEEVVLRNAIERILKRRIILGGKGKTIAEPLVRELVWARYFPDESLSASVVDHVAETIDAHLTLKANIVSHKILSEKEANEWMMHLLSSAIEIMLGEHTEKELMCSYMFQILRNNIHITDDSEQTKDVQTFLAVRKSFAKDDIAFLRYHLFTQYFGKLTPETVAGISQNFQSGYDEIQRELNYSRKDTIYGYVKNRTAVFFILDDILRGATDKKAVLSDENKLKDAVFAACEARYASIRKKVRTAIIRSVFFLLFSKVVIAFAVEGVYSSITQEEVPFTTMLINVAISPLLMVIVGLLIRAPGEKNTEKIFTYIKKLVSEEKPQIGLPLKISKTVDTSKSKQQMIFAGAWILAFVLTFGFVVYVLTQLGFNWVNQGIFIFFLAVVSFLCYRIALASRIYTVEDKPGIFAPIVDFFFMPIVRVGRRLTEGVSQINVILFIFDFIIETPFKGLFGFFEQLFLFLHAKREGLE